MLSRQIPATELRVSVVCLGTMTFGTPVAEPEATVLVRRGLDLGLTFIDTANMYEGYARYVGSPGGVAEEILGRALAGRRHEAVVATKVGMKVGPTPDDGGLGPAHIRRACERSLRRLATDWIDLYYLHKPDPDTPVADSVATVAGLIRAGWVRHWGLSNFDAVQTRAVLEACRQGGWPRPVAHQPAYSLIRPEIEADLLPLCRGAGLAVVPYRVLEGGLLTGKYRPGELPPAGSRGAEKPDWVPLLQDPSALDRLARLASEARGLGVGLYEHVLRRSLQVPGICSLVLGVTRPEQLEAAVAAVEVLPA